MAGTFFLRQIIPALVVGGCLAWPGAFAAGTEPDPLATREIDALTAADIDELAKLLQAEWQSSFETTLGIGWDSNLLLSSLTPEDSGFARAGVEGLLWHLPRNEQPVELIGFLNANYRRMFASESLPHDAQAFFQGEARWRPTAPVRLSLLAQGYYIDSVLDLSTESQRLAAPLRNDGVNTGLGVRWDPGSRWWLESTGSVTFSNFQDIPEDYMEYRLALRGGWQSTDGKLKLSLGVRQYDRRYQDRTLTTSGGRPIPGTELRYRTPELELTVEQSAEWHGTWRFNGSVAGGQNDDNGGGYYDYRLEKFLASLEWQRGAWSAQLLFETSHYRWEVQTAGIGLNPPLRERRDQLGTFQLDRQINAHWKVFIEAQRESVSSNEAAASYNVTMCVLGLGWKM